MDTGSKPENSGSSTSGGTTGTTGTTAKPKPKGYTNPALQAMGIPRIRLPSRNWSIFWAVTFSISGLYFYDRYERKQIRQRWKDRVSFLAKQPMNPLEIPRKVTVFIAPPPADYLDLGFAHFRQYIKPILVAAAIDYEVKSESRQGEIRSIVAEEIRNKRRADLGLPLTGEQPDDLDNMINSKVHKDNTGGVICVGRGAYKEYMNGLHEGWLGPLEAPLVETPATDAPQVEEVSIEVGHEATADSESAEPTLTESTLTEPTPTPTPTPAPVKSLDDSTEDFPDREKDLRDIYGELPEKTDEEKKEPEDGTEKKEEKKKKVPKPYIDLTSYDDIETPSQLETLAKFDPVAAISFPHLLGFRNFPRRVYRFFTRRNLADEMGEATSAVVFAHTRPFRNNEDVDLLGFEENDWPAQWKAKGLESGSEWMWDFKTDERIGNKLEVYEVRNDENLSSEFASDL